MIQINENYQKLQASYLFANIAQRVREYQGENPGRELIRMGIGDVTQPLPEACVTAMHKAVDELTRAETFRGYGPEQGYDFLREAIAKNDFQARGADIAADEVFVSDGAKCDTGNIQELFAGDIRVAIPDPVYPVYVDTNVMAGRTGAPQDGRYPGLVYLECTPANGYVPALPTQPVDLIYLCFPNNPTGATITRAQLKGWVDYARANKALILYDAAYEAFIRDPELPHSIYEIEGAQDVANQVYSGSFYDIFGALLSLLVLLSAILFAALAIAAIIAAKVMLFITLALAPIWIILWLYRWSSRMSEGFISLTTFLMIQQVLIYGFLGFYFSLVNAALNTATSGGATMDSKMSLVLPLVLVTIIGIYVLMQMPSIASILNGGGYLSTVGAYNPYRNFGRNAARYSGTRWAANRAIRGARQFAGNQFRRLRNVRMDDATRSTIQQATRENSRPLA